MSVQVLNRDHPKARKQHWCSDCGRTIEPGETYERQRNVGDDGLYVWKDCGHCSLVADWIWRNDEYAQSYDDGLEIGIWLEESGMAELDAAYRARWAGVTVEHVAALLAAELSTSVSGSRQTT